MNVEHVAQELAARLRMIPGVDAHVTPPGVIVAPAAVVGFPQRVDFDLADNRGTDQITLPIMLMVSKAPGRTAWSTLAGYLDGSGVRSVKQHLEADGAGVAGVFDYVEVSEATSDVTTWAEVDYLTLIFTVTVVGSGT